VVEPGLPHPLTRRPFRSPVPPGSGWPGDLANAETPVAADANAVHRLSDAVAGLDALGAAMSVCRACPRLVGWRESVARQKRKAFADQPYWGRPVIGWGSESPAVLIVGLAPAAHGGNRTGRIFTGDRSGDWLFASLHRSGLAAQASSQAAGDGQRLVNTRMVAPVRCAPPDNRPTPVERDTCAPWLDAELAHLAPTLRVAVCLGAYAWEVLARALTRLTGQVPSPRPRFGHGSRYRVGSVDVLGCYHPSQQNTFTGKLTEPMLDAVLGQAARLAGMGVR
jgi:uracil-DNA glycosylase